MVYIYLAEGFEEVEALTAADVLRRAGVDAKLVSISESLKVAGAHGICVEADLLMSQCSYENCRMLVLPGGMPGTLNLGADEQLCRKLQEFAADSDKKVAAICAAPMVLGKLGILEGRRATIYPGMEGYLTGAQTDSEKVVISGNVITSKGPGTAMDFALTLAGVLCGEETAENLRRDMIFG